LFFRKKPTLRKSTLKYIITCNTFARKSHNNLKNNNLKLKIMHQNINGLINNLSMLEIIINEQLPDILCLTEHHLNEKYIEMINLDGYVDVCHYCRTNKRGGGICFLARERIKSNKIDVLEFCTEGICEIIGIKITNLNKSKPIIILGIYRPPSGDVKLFFKLITKCLNLIYSNRSLIIVLGDLNIDLSKDTPNALKLKCLMKSFNLYNSINTYTREQNGSQSMIDHIFSNFDKEDINSFNLITNISDHHTQMSIIKTSISEFNSEKYILKRLFSDKNIVSFKNLLEVENWQILNLNVPIDKKYDELYTTLLQHLNKAIPICKIKINNKGLHDKIKLPEEVLNVRKRLKHLYLQKYKLKNDKLTSCYNNMKRE
jgi:exonuclease III